MIVKYLKDGVWGYIDNVRQAASKDINYEMLVYEYDSQTTQIDGSECMNEVKSSKEVTMANKVFFMACIGMADEGINRHAENLIDVNKLSYPTSAILLYLEDCKEYDAILLVTNQKCFLMNDKGQTIERLV